MRNLQEQVKKAFCYQKLFSDLSLFELIVLVTSKILQILSLQPRILKVFLNHHSPEHFFLSQYVKTILDNFGKKIPIIAIANLVHGFFLVLEL